MFKYERPREHAMEVYLRKNIEKVGLEGEIIKVGDGFARNFLIPQGLAVEITEHNKSHYESKIRKVENRKEVIATETSMLADQITNMTLTIKKKMHDNGQLYGSINATEVVDVLATKGINIAKGQVEFDKSIKSKVSFKVIIKLTSRLKPYLTIVVDSE